jgi:glycerol-3-phosphate O-acyltransferase / dihydroxyacetone phosphate acyltransferase
LGLNYSFTNICPAGIAIMALGALAQDTNVTVVPVGLNYFHAHKFRSRAVVEFGDPIAISSGLVEDFKSGKRRESVGELLESALFYLL